MADRTKRTCATCPHACELAEGQLGRCRARVGSGNGVADQNYGRLTSIAMDPIEKKPIARWMPGSYVLSVGSYGCNLRCPFCQNASIACATADRTPWTFVSPAQLVEHAIAYRREHPEIPVIGIAYTYNEPLVGWEYVRDTARLAHETGLKNVLVSNGMASEPVIRELLPLIDAANIDLKDFTQRFYDLVGGDLSTVKQTIALMADQPTLHLEVTTLVIPGLNDDPEEIRAAASWLASLDPTIPYHLTRFFPQHRMQDRPPTPRRTLEKLAAAANQHLNTVILGNV